ncbi:unnamed protein product [Debaryomyces tyrocola]|nr:unnamed protein product [Debaryomyces tyrocola]
MIGTDSYHIIIEIPESQDNHSLLDYRYSPIEVTAIDTSSENRSEMATNDIEPLKAKFLGDGNIRLYREFEEDETSLDFLSSTSSAASEPFSYPNATEGDDTMVSIIAVPTYFTATDLLGFIGDSYMKYITHLRILKSEKPNRFLVLIKFNDILKTAEFQLKYNGKPFNSMEPEACHVVFVKSIRFDAGGQIDNVSSEASESLIPFLLNDPFTSPPVSHPNSPNPKSSALFKKQTSGILMELPTCPVCLDRMDSAVTGLLTIPCQHTFHCQCLSKWKDDTCPICRYSNNVSNQKIRRSIRRLLQFSSSRSQHTTPIPGPSNSFGAPSDGTYNIDSAERCFDCQVDSNLWICLICGNLGCDRYAPEQHSLKHFISTGHCFAMELNTSRVWDYAGDNYVHRLVANESDGKLVELPEKETYNSINGQFNAFGNSNINFKSNNANPNFDKVDEVGFEYSQLLISQLASQREYYESLLNDRAGSRSHRGSLASDTTSNQNSIKDLEAKFEEMNGKLNDLTTTTIPSLKSKIALKDEKINVLTKELNNSNSLNDGLSSKVEYLSDENKQLTTQNKDLTEQVNDLMFYLESQEKFKNEPDDVRDGTVVIQQNQSSRRSRPKSKKKK